MFVYQNNKLYVQKSDKLVGVDITPSNVTELKDETAELASKYLLLTAKEVRLKFAINEIDNGSYKFPRKKKRKKVKKEPAE